MSLGAGSCEISPKVLEETDHTEMEVVRGRSVELGTAIPPLSYDCVRFYPAMKDIVVRNGKQKIVLELELFVLFPGK